MMAAVPADWLTLADLGIAADAPETGDTYAANAIQKAQVYCQLTGRWTLADDSGLDVDALQGRPGVFTARYGGGHAAPDAKKWAALLAELAHTPWRRRTAQFRCVLALARPGQPTLTASGVCPGVITFSPAGNGGFGYDPLFYVPQFGCTLAQVAAAQKDQISHRGRASQAMADQLLRLLR